MKVMCTMSLRRYGEYDLRIVIPALPGCVQDNGAQAESWFRKCSWCVWRKWRIVTNSNRR